MFRQHIGIKLPATALATLKQFYIPSILIHHIIIDGLLFSLKYIRAISDIFILFLLDLLFQQGKEVLSFSDGDVLSLVVIWLLGWGGYFALGSWFLLGFFDRLFLHFAAWHLVVLLFCHLVFTCLVGVFVRLVWVQVLVGLGLYLFHWTWLSLICHWFYRLCVRRFLTTHTCTIHLFL